MVLVSTLVVGTGGAAAPVVVPAAQAAQFAQAADKAVKTTDAAVKTGIVLIRIASGKAATASIIAPTTGVNAALVSAGTGGAATGAATTVAAANVWNPVGWMIGSILVGVEQCASHTVTWACYKPIIGEVYDEVTLVEPITFAALTAHPNIRQVSVGTSAASAGLPDVEVANTAGARYLLRGVTLPWGATAYHAERIDNGAFLS